MQEAQLSRKNRGVASVKLLFRIFRLHCLHNFSTLRLSKQRNSIKIRENCNLLAALDKGKLIFLWLRCAPLLIAPNFRLCFNLCVKAFFLIEEKTEVKENGERQKNR